MTHLTGKVYSLSGRPGGAREPHPHVVVIEFAEECLLVPAFSSGGYEIERYKQVVLRALGLRADQAFVEIDNAQCVRFYDARAGHTAAWVVERADRWTLKDLKSRAPIGEMNETGLFQIVTALLALVEARPGAYSPHLVKRLKKLATALAANATARPEGKGGSPAGGT